MTPKNPNQQTSSAKKLDTQVMSRIAKSISEMPIRVSNVPPVKDDTQSEPPAEEAPA